MIPMKHITPAERILAALDNAPQVENYAASEIEALPIKTVNERLEELGLDPALPPYIEGMLRGRASPAHKIIAALDDEEEWAVEKIQNEPLEDVTARLNNAGLNYRAGVEAVRELTGASDPQCEEDPSIKSIDGSTSVEMADTNVVPFVRKPAVRWMAAAASVCLLLATTDGDWRLHREDFQLEQQNIALQAQIKKLETVSIDPRLSEPPHDDGKPTGNVPKVQATGVNDPLTPQNTAGAEETLGKTPPPPPSVAARLASVAARQFGENGDGSFKTVLPANYSTAGPHRYSASDIEAEQEIQFQTNLMVASSACGGDTAYSQFQSLNKDAILRYQNAMIDHFRRTGARNPKSAFDAWQTSLANDVARKQAVIPTAERCKQATEMLKLTSFPHPRTSHEYAVGRAVNTGGR